MDPATGTEAERHPVRIQAVFEKWEALSPIGSYGSMTKRRGTIIVDVPNEDAFFEALHATWVAFNTYPEVWPVVEFSDMPAVMQRLGLA